jgi:uncharacterized protein (DUF934 family)
MALVKDGRLVDDPFRDVTGEDRLPASGALLIDSSQWQDHREALVERNQPLGIKLHSDEQPANIVRDLDHFAMVALDFPVFRDGRPYSYARLLRERYGFTGELRAVGDVLLEQLHYMHRAGFNAFQLDSSQPLEDWQTAMRDISVWYQPTGDGRRTAVQLRRSRHKTPCSGAAWASR